MNTEDLANRAISLARMWATVHGSERVAWPTEAILAHGNEPAILDLACSFLDRVLLPEDPAVVADFLQHLPRSLTKRLGLLDRTLLELGRTLAPILPGLVATAARRRVWTLARPAVVVDAPETTTRHITTTLANGHRINFRPLGAPVLGRGGAKAYRQRAVRLLQRPDVDYLTIKTPDLLPAANLWDFRGEVDRMAQALREVYAASMQQWPAKFVALDPHAYADLAVTVAAFEEVLSEANFMHLAAGVTLPAHMPEATQALGRLIDFAQQRVQAGGAPIKVRLHHGAHWGSEHVEAELCSWSPATHRARSDADAHLLRLIETALDPTISYALRVGIASNNLFHLAYAHMLAAERGVQAALDVELAHTTPPTLVRAIQAEVVNPVILDTPLLRPGRARDAVPLLAHRLIEAAAPVSFRDSANDADLGAHERRFLQALRHHPPQGPPRRHLRVPAAAEFAATAPADPALATTRRYAHVAVGATPPEPDDVPRPAIHDGEVHDAVAAAANAAAQWDQEARAARADQLRRMADDLENQRKELLGLLNHDTGMLKPEADGEINSAIDLLRSSALDVTDHAVLAAEEGIELRPDRVVLVVPGPNAPLAQTMAGVGAAGAVGAAAVVLAPAHAYRCVHAAVNAARTGLAARGLDPNAVQVLAGGDDQIEQELLAHPLVDAVLLTGSADRRARYTAWRSGRAGGARVHSWPADMNVLVVTPSADLDQAVGDIIDSAFRYAGQAPGAAQALILVGSVATNVDFRAQLLDATRSLQVDWATRPHATLGPLIAPATEAQLALLQDCDEEETWLLAPTRLDDAGRLWSPGIKTGITPSTWLGRPSSDVPVLGIMTARTLTEAIEWCNDSYRDAAALHSLNEREIDHWVASVRARNVHVNRPTTATPAARQPYSGRGRAGLGTGIGGVHDVAALGQWQQGADPSMLGEIGPSVGVLLDATAQWLDPGDRAWLRAAARSDAHAREVYRTVVDEVGLVAEESWRRYVPAGTVTIRAGADTALVEVLRVWIGAVAVGVEPEVSVPPNFLHSLPPAVPDSGGIEPAETAARPGNSGQRESEADFDGEEWGGISLPWRVETRAEFLARAAQWNRPRRLRCLAQGELGEIERVVPSVVDVVSGPVLQSGKRELLTFLRAQTVTRIRHRHGRVSTLKGWPAPAAGRGE